MKKSLIIVLLLVNTIVFAQIKGKQKEKENTVYVVEPDVVTPRLIFNPNFKNTYFRNSDNELISLKITGYSQHYTTEDISETTSIVYKKTIPVFTIKIQGEYMHNGRQRVYFNFSYTDLESFKAVKYLIENYDIKGKLILTKKPVDINDTIQDALSWDLPGSENKKEVFPIMNDIVQYLNKI